VPWSVWYGGRVRGLFAYRPLPVGRRPASCGVVEADLELCCNCWSAGFLGERLHVTITHAAVALDGALWQVRLTLPVASRVADPVRVALCVLPRPRRRCDGFLTRVPGVRRMMCHLDFQKHGQLCW